MATDSDNEINIYSIAVRYFEKARKYLSAAKKHYRASIEYDALLSMAIISYWGPFSKHVTGPDGKKSQLNMEDFDFWNDDQRAFHKKLQGYRDQGLAHPDFEFNPTRFNPETKVFSGAQFSILNQDIDLEVFDKLLAQLISDCHAQRAKHSRPVAAEKAEQEDQQ